jgi:cyclase
LDLGGLVARVLMAPGHSPSNLLVWVESEGVLYAGDTIVAGYLPNLESGGPDGWRQWLQALRVVETLHPEIVVPGHGPVLREGEISREMARIRKILEDALTAAQSP